MAPSDDEKYKIAYNDLYPSEKIKTNHRKTNLVGLKKELINRKDSDNFKPSQEELISLLETKHDQGKVSEETYNSILKDIHSIDK